MDICEKYLNMSIQNAIDFFEIYQKEKKLRNYLGSLNSAKEVRDFIAELELPFTDEEFEEAYNLQILRCKDEADHNLLIQIKQSYILSIS